MKSITIIFLLSLFTLSFVADCGLLSISKKAAVEICDNTDTEEAVKDAKKNQVPAVFYHSNAFQPFLRNSAPSISSACKLSNVDYTVHIQPPRV